MPYTYPRDNRSWRARNRAGKLAHGTQPPSIPIIPGTQAAALAARRRRLTRCPALYFERNPSGEKQLNGSSSFGSRGLEGRPSLATTSAPAAALARSSCPPGRWSIESLPPAVAPGIAPGPRGPSGRAPGRDRAPARTAAGRAASNLPPSLSGVRARSVSKRELGVARGIVLRPNAARQNRLRDGR